MRRDAKTLCLFLVIALSFSACTVETNTLSTPFDTIPTSITNDLVLGLEGLPIEQFYKEAFKLILVRNPEAIIEYGLEAEFDSLELLTNISPDYPSETREIHQLLLDRLLTYPLEKMTSEQQVSYQVFKWYLEDAIEGYEYHLHAYPVTNFTWRSIPQTTIILFTETLPLNSYEDALLYIERLAAIAEKFDQLQLQLTSREELGIIPPQFIIKAGRAEINKMLGATPNSSPLYTHFQEEIANADGISQSQEDELLNAALEVLEQQVMPAFALLDTTLLRLEELAGDTLSVYQFEGGEDYYQYMLNHFNTVDIPAEEIHALGLQELARIQAEMRINFSELGYEEGIGIPEAFQLVITESGTLTGQDIVDKYELILQHADENLDAYFDLRPQTNLEVIGGDVGAFYSPGSLDGTRPGKFYARTNKTEPIFKMHSVAYHEGIPGHHYQIALAQEADLPLFRSVMIFDAYTEGWALYAEYLPAELGWYADDPYGNLGRLQYEALRACRMIVDTGIHTYGWSYDEAIEFMIENTGINEGFATWEVERYIAYPAQAPSYMVGKLEILRLRNMAETELGDAFDIREFHNIVLKNGSVPLSILEQLILDWIAEAE